MAAGVILNARAKAAWGSTITLSGYDLGWLLTSCAPFGRDRRIFVKFVLARDIAKKLIDPSWLVPGAGIGKLSGSNGFGLRSIIGISTSRQVRQGASMPRRKQCAKGRRLQQERQTAPKSRSPTISTRAVMPKVMVQPGETVADILIRYAKLEQRFINVTPDGDLFLLS